MVLSPAVLAGPEATPEGMASDLSEDFSLGILVAGGRQPSDSDSFGFSLLVGFAIFD
jgi:hypothetical protein